MQLEAWSQTLHPLRPVDDWWPCMVHPDTIWLIIKVRTCKTHTYHKHQSTVHPYEPMCSHHSSLEYYIGRAATVLVQRVCSWDHHGVHKLGWLVILAPNKVQHPFHSPIRLICCSHSSMKAVLSSELGHHTDLDGKWWKLPFLKPATQVPCF